MRNLRLREIRRSNKLIGVFVKLLAVFYLFLWAFVPITGQTNAFFTDTSTVTGVIQAGSWAIVDVPSCSENLGQGDCSKLKLTGERFDGKNIYASIKNTGETMKTNGKYEVYFIEKGNPKNGSKVSVPLTFIPITKGQEQEILFTPANSGFYSFKIFDEDYPGKGVHELWSGEIEVRLLSKENSSNETVGNEPTEKQEEVNNSIEKGNESSTAENEMSEENINTGENN
nr:amyloid fiber anchoring/assembly protein TapA [Neobacillus soli]